MSNSTTSTTIRTIPISKMEDFESNPTLMSALFSHVAAFPPYGPFSHLSCGQFCTKMKEPHEIIENQQLTHDEISSFNNNNNFTQQQQQQYGTIKLEEEEQQQNQNNNNFNSSSSSSSNTIFIDDNTGIAYKQVRVLVSYDIQSSSLVQALFMKLWDLDQWRHWGILETAMDLRLGDVDKL